MTPTPDQPNRKAHPPMVHPDDPLKLKGGITLPTPEPIALPTRETLGSAALTAVKKIAVARKAMEADTNHPPRYCEFYYAVCTAMDELARAAAV